MEPEDVFTPGTSVGEHGTFASRPDEVHLLRNALRETGAQIAIYGDRGVGKTSLVKHVLWELNSESVRFACAADTTFEELANDILQQTGAQLHTKTQRRSTGAGK